ncbi:MAG: T9SS type A sorting domain-containing protein [candidate division Zixibacteria bacterium]|nr:T9SS type A sorting domain-containing protein [candidate division Zixibacteria bacterium]
MSKTYFTRFFGILATLLVAGVTVGTTPTEARYAIYADSVESGAGSDVSVRFYLANEMALTSLSVPISYDPSLVTLKSISFTDSRAQHIANKMITPSDIDVADGHFMVAIFQWMEDPIEAGDGLLFTAIFGLNPEAEVGQSTLLDTLFYPPAGVLEVVRADTSGGIQPDFGPGMIIIGENNRTPVFATLPDQYVLEGDSLDLTIIVSDPDEDLLTLAITTKPTGATFVDNGDGTARFVWVPDYVGPNSADGSPLSLSFWASDGDLSSQMDLNIYVLNRNRKPSIMAPTEAIVEAGETMSLSVSAFDPDFETITWSWSGLPEGATFDGDNPGLLSWTSEVTDTGSFVVAFVATDPQGLADTLAITTQVRAVALFTLAIDSVEAFPNEDVEFKITLDNKLPVAGFNILFNHDPIALGFLSLTNAETRTEAFEYFTVRTTENGIAGNVRIIGIGDMGGGTPGLEAGDGPIASVRVHTTGDLAFAGMSIPLTFQFLDAPINDDNSLTDSIGTRIEQADIVYQTGSVKIHDIGQIRIGDINLNGIAAEIGDVIYFTNFFINPSLYKFNALQYANSDVNRDYIAATVSDLVALINWVVGGNTYSKISDGGELTASVEIETYSNQALFSYESSVAVGAAYFVIKSDREVTEGMITSRCDNMAMNYHQDGDRVKVLLYSLDGEVMPSGRTELFEISGGVDFEISHVELGSSGGQQIEVALASAGAPLPIGFALMQNYPNPFNPETNLEFALPYATHVTLTVYNVLGQAVVTLVNDELPAGTHGIQWRGTDQQGQAVASGVYLYRLQAGTETMTRKMMLLK